MLATVNGTANADNITVDIVGANIIVTVNGTPNSFNDAAEATIVVNGLGGADTITILRNGLNATTINGGAGNDTANVGNTDFDSTINANVVVNGGADVDSLNLIDTADALGGDASTLTATTFKKAAATTLTWSAAGAELVEAIDIGLGPQAETLVISGVGVGVSTSINGGSGNDTVTFGDSALGVDFDDAAFGNSLTINGGVGSDSLVIDDASDVGADTYTLAGTTFTKSSTAIVATYSSFSFHHMISPAGAITHTYNLHDISGAVTITAGDGADTLNFGDNVVNLEFVDSPVLFEAGPGTDRINYNDTNNAVATDVYTINTNTVAVTGTATLTHSLVETVVVNGSNVGTSYIVAGMGTSSVTINAGDGNDTLGGTTFTVDMDNLIDGPLSFNGQGGTDSVGFGDDEIADGPENYTITGTSFTKTAIVFGGLQYTATELLNFVLDGDSSLVTIGALSDGQSVTVNAGAGNDTVQNDASNNFSVDWEDVNVNLVGGIGTDVLDLDDSVSAAPTYNIDEDEVRTLAFSVTGPSGTAMDTFETISLLLGSAGSTINVVGLEDTPSFTLNAGDGNDTVNIGGTAGSDLDDIIGFSATGLISLIGGAGTDSLHFRDTDDEVGADVYLVDDPAFTVGAGGVDPVVFNYNTVERFGLNGSNLGHTYNVEDTAMLSNIVGGTGNDRFSLAPVGQDLDAVNGGVTIAGGAGNDTATLNDDLDTVADSYSVTATLISKPAGFVGGLSYSDIDRLELDANADNNTINVASTALGTVYDLAAGAGNDTFNIASTDNMDNVDGQVTLLGGTGTDTVNYNDALNAAVTTYTMGGGGSQTITRTGAANVIVGVDSESVTVNAGSGNNTINWNAWNASFGPAATTLNAGNGSDAITIGNGDYDTNIGAPIVVNAGGGGGQDTVTVNDATDNDPGDTYTLTSSVFTDGGAPLNTLIYSGADVFNLLLPGGNETVNIASSIGGTTSINGGAGNDTVNMTATDLDSLNGIVIVDGADGLSDRFNLDNTGDAAGGPNTITFSQFSTTIGQLVNVDAAPDDVVRWVNTTELIGLVDGAAPTVFNIDSLVTGSSVSINGGDGNDTFNAGGGDYDLNLAAGTTIPNLNGGLGTDVLNINDSADNVGGDTMTINATRLIKNGQFVDYVAFEGLNIAGSPQVTNYLVESTNATTPTNIVGGGAADTFDVGSDIDLGMLGSTTITGGGGGDRVVLNDLGDAADPDVYTFFDNGPFDVFAKTGSAGIFMDVENVRLDANNGNNTITVTSLSTALTINANSGDDQINVADGGTTAAPVSVTSGIGNDTLNVDSDNDAIEAFVVLPFNEQLSTFSVRAGSLLRLADSAPGVILIVDGAVANLQGQLDVRNGHVINRVGGTPVGTWATRLTNGFNAGAWNGNASAVVSSNAASSAIGDGVGYGLASELNLPANLYNGVAVNPGDVIMSYTLNGDTDLDRAVDFDDLLKLAQNYDPNTGGKSWTQGNVNYNAADNVPGGVGFADLLALAQNYGLSTPALTAAPSSAGLDGGASRRTGGRTLSSLADDVLA